MRRPVVRGALWLSAGAASWIAIGIAGSRRRARQAAAPPPPQVHVPPPSPAPATDIPTSEPQHAPRAALVAGIVLLAALGAAFAFFATRDDRRAPAATAAVAGTATVRHRGTPASPPHTTRAVRKPTPGRFVPARVFAWPASAGADRYEIRFYRGGELLLRKSVRRPRFVLPTGLHLGPGRYRWLVLTYVRGSLGPAVVDSRFTVRSR
jgi:hypothetical protein